jgi:N-succinyldiaminopimelate aminotransferase
MTRLATERGAINLAQGFPDFDAPEQVLEEAVRALRGGKNQYARSMGHLPLCEAVTWKVEHDYGMRYDPEEEVLITSGATEAIASALLGLLNPGDRILFFEPHYDSYPVCAAMAGADCGFFTLRFPEFRMDIEELERCFTERTRILFINTPHNPTGKVFSAEELRNIAELCLRHDVLVITDEVYEHITYDGARHTPIASLPGMRDRTLTISGAGKTFSLTGWRVGWATGPKPLIAAVQRAHQYITFAPATPLQAALAVVLTSIGDGYFEGLRSDYARRRDILVEALNGAGIDAALPEGTYYVLGEFTKLFDGDDRSFVEHLIDTCGVAAIPPASFYTACPEEGRKLVRFAFCKREETLALAAERLRRLTSG